LTGFLAVFAFAAFEGTFALFLGRTMGWNARAAAFAFAGIGFASALVQGGLIRRLAPRFGEPRLIMAGLVLAVLGFAGLAQASGAAGLVGSMILLAIGQGLLSPSLAGLLSRITPPSEQGAVFGTFSSSQTLARMISYSTSNLLLGKISTGAPYWQAFGVDLFALALAVRLAWNFRLGTSSVSADTREKTTGVA
jgi:DHA1 family tetracycline resistance protein-like MFS transporter